MTVVARVEDVRQFENISEEEKRKLLQKWGKDLGLEDIDRFLEGVKNKKHVVLIFLKDVQRVSQPFKISKKGFGAMASWISVEDGKKIRI